MNAEILDNIQYQLKDIAEEINGIALDLVDTPQGRPRLIEERDTLLRIVKQLNDQIGFP